jgi:hypothetical protein
MTNVVANASGAAGLNIAINFTASPALTMTNVTAAASGGAENHAIRNHSSSPNMTNVRAIASGSGLNFGIYNHSSSPVLNNVVVSSSGNGTYAMYNTSASSPTINNSNLRGGMDAIYSAGGGIVMVHNSQLSGNVWNESSTVKIGGSNLGFAGGPGGVTCAANYNANYVFFPNTCP